MVNDDQQDPQEVVCPAEPLEAGLSFAHAEIAPLLDFLSENRSAAEPVVFQRGTVTPAQTLDCCKQSLGPAGAKLITQALKGNDKIKAILLGTGSIANEGAASVASLLKENTSIETVYLGCNLIDATGLNSLTASLEGNSTVHALWLKRNPLGTEGAKALAKLLKRNRNLRTLDLVNTLIGREGLAALVETLLEEDYPLERLYLSGNHLKADSADVIAQLIQHHSSLEELYLSVNPLGDESMEVLAPALAQNRSLRILSLASCGIEPRGVPAIFQALAHHPSLQVLDFSYAPSTKVLGSAANWIGTEGAKHVAEFIKLNRSLLKLDIRRTDIASNGIKWISMAMRDNEHLMELLFDKGSAPWHNDYIKTKTQQNRQGKSLPSPAADVQAIKSVYR